MERGEDTLLHVRLVELELEDGLSFIHSVNSISFITVA